MAGLPLCAMSQNVERPRPFESFSESAQRLKASLGERVGRVTARSVEIHDPAVLELSEQALRDSVVTLERQQLGRRYVRGGTTPSRGFDCSGLVRFVLNALHLGVPRVAHDQANAGLAVTPDTSALRPGDLVTFGSRRVNHIGIYTGDGKFIHASVTAGRVIESSITRRTSPLIRKWTGARRLLALAELGEPETPALRP
jgi:uncharacterized protein YfaT (DUF1175 family)